jgi:hypothetical protein
MMVALWVISDGLDDGQSQAKSVAAAGSACGEALKRLEEPVYYGHWDRGP